MASFKLSEEDLAAEKDFLAEFHTLCQKYGYFDKVKVVTSFLNMTINCTANISSGGFIERTSKVINGTERFRLILKGEIVNKKMSDDPEDIIKQLKLRIEIGSHGNNATLSNRGDKLDAYRKDKDFIKLDTDKL